MRDALPDILEYRGSDELALRNDMGMTTDEHFRKLERMYGKAPCNEYYSPELTISKGAAILVIPVQQRFYHSSRPCMVQCISRLSTTLLFSPLILSLKMSLY